MDQKVRTIKLIACSPPRCACPELEMDFESCEVEIRDDYGGIVKMSFTEFTNLATRFLEHV